MKKFLLFFLSLLAIGTAQAAPNFKANTKYRISCKKFNSSNSYGSVVIGSNHSKLVELYYDSGNSYSDDSWWYINKSGNGYVIVNAKSGQYLTFTTTKNYRTKYVTLTNAASGNESQWIFDINEDGYAGIASASEGNGSGYHFNVRIDGTNLFGAYRANYYDENELFKIYDEQGNNVLLDNSGSGGETGGGSGGETGGEGTDDFNATTYGKTSYGEYWERTQLKQPIVYTTSVADPVLYSIANLRTGRYVGVGTSMNTNTTCLTEVYSASDRTQFYFVQSGTGVQIFTKDGQYVSTNYPTPDNSVSDKRAGLSVVNSTPNGNLWGFGWTTNTYSGYTITKLDNLSATDATQYEYNSWNDYSLDNNTGSSNVHEVGLYEGDDAGSSFVFTSADLRHAKYLQNKGIDFGLDVTPKAFAEAFDSLRINDKQLVYDGKGNAYFATLPEGMRNGGDYTAKVTYKLKTTNAEGYTLKVNGQEPDADGYVTFDNVDCETLYPIELTNASENVDLSANIRFTFLPIVELNCSSVNSKAYTTGSLRVTDPASLGYDSLMIAAFKYRGASSSNYPKRSYAIKLRDENGNSVDRKLLGYRSDNNWILDAMYIDLACMRNRVATDLWNAFECKPYYADREKKVRTGTRGKFVEVILNGQWWGLYCMTEKMDRKQLKLKKFVPAAQSTTGENEVHGVLYKSNQWTYEVFMGHESNDDNDNKQVIYPHKKVSDYKNILGQETWCEYEFKYPDYEDEAVEWRPLHDAANMVATSFILNIDSVKSRFDYPMLRDYYLFIDLLLATDNHGKNLFWYAYDTQGPEGDKLSLAPWDLDGTFGQDWDGVITNTKDVTLDFDTYIKNYEHGQFAIFDLIKSRSEWQQDLKDRYAELRIKGVISGDSIANRFANYASLFEASLADQREQNMWSKAYHSRHKDIQGGATYAESWIRRRVNWLDQKYGFDAAVTAINEAKAEAYFAALGGVGCISVNAGKAQSVRIYNIAGQLVRNAQVGSGVTTINGIPAGIYVVNGTKVMVK
ncbi:CotH kinase family protein [Prevotellamassilia timonensis]|uniref:CotH kinase family protein n=1 Tax=Prevotellamassilia timonensis TaxID=1852370 RepID=UPI003FED5D56